MLRRLIRLSLPLVMVPLFITTSFRKAVSSSRRRHCR
jgi:hypothetical protein